MKSEILREQTKNAYDWTNKLLDSIPVDAWDVTPDIIESNISWQVGHLILSTYFHSIIVIAGHQKSILEKIPMKKYTALYSQSDPKKSVAIVEPELLWNQLLIVQDKSIEIISSLSEEDLQSELESSRTPHPVATTKYEALDWNVKHTMWHCSQISILKRIVHKRFDFSLKQAK